MKIRGDQNLPDDPAAVDVEGGAVASIMSGTRNAEKQDDEYDTYCKSLAQKFRVMGQSDRRGYLEVQNTINRIVHQADMNSLLAD